MERLSHRPIASHPGAVPVQDPDTHIDEGTGGSGWIVTVFDNDVNTVDEVMMILILATRCTEREAAIETWEVHNLGKSVVHHSGKQDCERVASIIATIGIRVTVTEE